MLIFKRKNKTYEIQKLKQELMVKKPRTSEQDIYPEIFQEKQQAAIIQLLSFQPS